MPPAALSDPSGAGYGAKASTGYRGSLLAECTYPILPEHQGGAMWFYALPEHDRLCRPAEKLCQDYLGAVRDGNLFSLDVGPDYAGKLREIDVATLRQVGQRIRETRDARAAAKPAG